jgi:hypothetical protein
MALYGLDLMVGAGKISLEFSLYKDTKQILKKNILPMKIPNCYTFKSIVPH